MKRRVTSREPRRALATASGGGVHAASLDVLPGIAPKEPDSNQHPDSKNHQQCKLRPRLHHFRLDRRQIPLREGPHKLAVQPDQRQRPDKEHNQRQGSDAHRIEQHHRPVIDAIACGCSGDRLCGALRRNPGRAASYRRRAGKAACGAHGRTSWRRRTHALQPTTSPSVHAAFQSTCTAAHYHCQCSSSARQCGDNCLSLHQLS